MPDFDLSKVSVEIAKLLMSRGTGIPSLQYGSQQNLMAKKSLDAMDNPRLFGDVGIRDPRQATAVRALLYLYTGWAEGAIECAAPAGGFEQAFISAIAERHLAHTDAAKKWLQKTEADLFFASIYERAQQMLRSEADSQVKRFRDILEMNKSWEPFAFVDLFEQARNGKLSPVGEQAVCKLQDIEFELILSHCFLGATGRAILKRRVISEADEQRREQEYRRRMAERRDREERQRKAAEAKKVQEATSAKPKAPAAPPAVPKAKVLCPKCNTVVFVDEKLRGKAARCFKCNTAFRVPHKKTDGKPFVASKGAAR